MGKSGRGGHINSLIMTIVPIAAHIRFRIPGWYAFFLNEINTIPRAPVPFRRWYESVKGERTLKLTSTYANTIAQAPYQPIDS